jgi:hypothetical protein
LLEVGWRFSRVVGRRHESTRTLTASDG